MSTTDLLTRRYANLAGLLACAGMMGFALFAQHVLKLDPCPLCVFQRIATIALGLVFLLALAHNPKGWGSRAYAVLLLLVAGTGASIAARHVWIQNLPPDQVPACGADLDYLLDTVPLTEVLRQVFTGSGECAEVVWSFLGLSMPSWVFICLSGLGLFGLLTNLKLPAAR